MPKINICRDSATKLSEAECIKKGLPYDEYADIEVEVSGTFVPGCKGSRDKWGAPMEPDEEACVEDVVAHVSGNYFRYDENGQETTEILFADGEEISLTDKEDDEACDAIACDVHESAESAKESYYESRYEDER